MGSFSIAALHPSRDEVDAKAYHGRGCSDVAGTRPAQSSSNCHAAKPWAKGIRRRTAHGVDMYVNHETLAHPDNRLVRSKTHRDALGISHPEVTYDVGEYVHKSAKLSREHLKRIAEALGGTEIEMTSFFTPNNHITGGTIMGLDPKDSVVDGWLRTHDHANLFLATGAAMARRAP